MINLTAPWVAPLLAEIAHYPGELADRKIRYGAVVVCDVPTVGIPPVKRWVERLREVGLLRPARVRAMPTATTRRVARLCVTREQRIMGLLLGAGVEGLAMTEISEALDGAHDPGGTLEEAVVELYRGGLASPPAGLWVGADLGEWGVLVTPTRRTATEAGRAVVAVSGAG